MDQNLYELGRYKKKVADDIKVIQALRSRNAFLEQLLDAANLYIVHFASKGQTLPFECEVDYAELKALSKRCEVKFEPIKDEGMKLCILEKTNTETTKS